MYQIFVATLFCGPVVECIDFIVCPVKILGEVPFYFNSSYFSIYYSPLKNILSFV